MLTSAAYAHLRLSEVVSYDTFRHHCPSAHVVKRGPDAPVFRTHDVGEHFTFVVRGRVKMVRRRKKRDSILNLAESGDMVCQAIPFTRDRHCCTALVDCPEAYLLVVPRRELLTLLAHEPKASQLFVGALAHRTVAMCARTAELQSGAVEQRIAALLCRLADSVGTRENGVLRVNVPLSRRDLAELCATSTETAIRRMRAMEASGLLRTHTWGFTLLDETALRELAEG